MKVGVLAYRYTYYSNVRTIVGKLPEVSYVPVKDYFSYARNFAFRVNKLLGKPLFPVFNLNNQFEDFDLNRVDLLHFSNGVSYGRTPWVSSFETILPRFSELVTRHQGENQGQVQMTELVKRGLNALAGRSCKQIIAWSECSAAIQRDLLAGFPASYSQAILPKMTVIQPPQEALVDHVPTREYDSGHPIRFILVGAAFFRKGGRELLNTFRKLAGEEHLPLKLVVVSTLRLEPYAAKETAEDAAAALKELNSGEPWIEYYSSLPNDQVLALMKNCDVGLLPTWADTYGISVIEAQGCGLPVITTDSRALPEMNNNKIGWLIRVPQNRLREALYTTVEERKALSAAIQTGLEETIRRIAADPSQIAAKGALALQKIREQHDPVVYANRLRAIYQAAVGKKS